MFRRRKYYIVVVHKDELLWLDDQRDGTTVCVFRLSMDKLIDNDGGIDQFPKELRGNYRSLLIVPDHWFGTENYPFRSRKAALIEPFLERKLTNEYPDIRDLRHFISYRHAAIVGEGTGVSAYFIQDIKGFQLYQALCKVNLCPRQITTPAFLWMETLSRITTEFDRSGVLLIHMIESECLLYFYFNNNYLFSRNVVLAETEERLSALTFEINQSLYMFSQKTKNELNHIYLLNDSGDDLQSVKEALGREVVEVDSLLERIDSLETGEIHFLNRVLQRQHLSPHPSFLHVCHRKVRHALSWEPVQWSGIAIGLLLLLLLLGESVVLGRMLQTHQYPRPISNPLFQHHKDITVDDALVRLDHLLQVVEKPQVDVVINHLLASLPVGVRIKSLELLLDEQAALSLTAYAAATDADQLTQLLVQLAQEVQRQFVQAQNFSVNDIAIQTDNSKDAHRPYPYVISFKLDLV